jgi:hypothetical protein
MKRRLQLKKVTLRDLDASNLGGVAGGTNTYAKNQCTVATCDGSYCCDTANCGPTATCNTCSCATDCAQNTCPNVQTCNATCVSCGCTGGCGGGSDGCTGYSYCYGDCLFF